MNEWSTQTDPKPHLSQACVWSLGSGGLRLEASGWSPVAVVVCLEPRLWSLVPELLWGGLLAGGCDWILVFRRMWLESCVWICEAGV